MYQVSHTEHHLLSTGTRECMNGGRCISGECYCPVGFVGAACEIGELVNVAPPSHHWSHAIVWCIKDGLLEQVELLMLQSSVDTAMCMRI